ncbi:MAG: RagB/SusD family nutrient uptake outer membrane protein [Prevotellaceae bacterium]|jgi:hypothetical protein|nr:RagB/SusD family nutrient uptake outer membrane protein [Prevotellaceae bacterium]
MKKYLSLLILGVALSSCTEWLGEEVPGTTKLNDFFSVGERAIQVVTGAYVPLSWEYNTTYYSEWFIGDIMSDDALKGGANTGDMAMAYDMENFKVNGDNTLLLDFYRAQYQGISRCNVALKNIPDMAPDEVLTTSMRDRLMGEAYFLRAMYYFRLVRVFGGVPKVDFVITSSDNWQQPRASAEDIYVLIEQDLQKANAMLWKKSEYPLADLGRATKGAAQAMLLKVNLYQKKFSEAKAWGDSIQLSGEYELAPTYAEQFLLSGENDIESVFEIQYIEDPTSDYGEGDGFSRGTFTTVLTRSRSSQLGGGWGFNHPTQNLYDEFESGDPRRDASIFTPDPGKIDNPEEEIYLGSSYLNRKLIWIELDNSFPQLAHASRGPLNRKVIRYADVLLMYAEACAESNALSEAKAALERVRARARGGDASILPQFPNYRGYTDSRDDLIQAIRHERRVELAMEGHRWYDICRWGIAQETMEAYKLTETPEARNEMAPFIKGKHELLPIPNIEIERNPMDQNPEYF